MEAFQFGQVPDFNKHQVLAIERSLPRAIIDNELCPIARGVGQLVEQPVLGEIVNA